MSYRLDPQLDERLARLVDALPRPTAPRTPEPVEYRTPRGVLVVIAVVLVLAAIISYLWLTNSPPLPGGASLTCDEIDFFRCRGSATTAYDWFEEILPSVPRRASHRIVSVEVWSEAVEENICRPAACPSDVRERIDHVDIVKIGYAPSDQDWLTLVWCVDGSHRIGGTTLTPSWRGRLNSTPDAC
jgi:hypothetical protein